jgi:hypothetical protein
VLGKTLGNFRVLRQIGAGGMGVVYFAQHVLIGRQAAIKVLLPEYSADPEFVNRFFNEARATATIRHPGLVEVFDFGFHPSGAAYLVMEFLEGETLAVRLARDGRLPPWLMSTTLRQVASAVGAAHQAGIVHRDLKPENIFLIPGGGPDRRGRARRAGGPGRGGGRHRIAGPAAGRPRGRGRRRCAEPRAGVGRRGRVCAGARRRGRGRRRHRIAYAAAGRRRRTRARASRRRSASAREGAGRRRCAGPRTVAGHAICRSAGHPDRRRDLGPAAARRHGQSHDRRRAQTSGQAAAQAAAQAQHRSLD